MCILIEDKFLYVFCPIWVCHVCQVCLVHVFPTVACILSWWAGFQLKWAASFFRIASASFVVLLIEENHWHSCFPSFWWNCATYKPITTTLFENSVIINITCLFVVKFNSQQKTKTNKQYLWGCNEVEMFQKPRVRFIYLPLF